MKTLLEIKEMALALCYAIETLPASKEATDLSIMASSLHTAIQRMEDEQKLSAGYTTSAIGTGTL